jgi:major membrane immunogen (membrane-anchored lipoprotein)
MNCSLIKFCQFKKKKKLNINHANYKTEEKEYNQKWWE